MSAPQMSASLTLIYSPWPDVSSATAAARALVEAGECACVNILPTMTSVYRWDGEVQQDDECVMLVKVPTSAVDSARARIEALHPYETPCVLAIGDVSANPAFAAWAEAQIR